MAKSISVEHMQKTKKQVVFREVMEKDAKELASLFSDANVKNYEKAIKRSIKGKSVKGFVAESNGSIIGHIKASFSGEPYAHIVELKSLIVRPDYRGKGIGLGLYKYAISKTGKNKKIAIARVRTINEPSVKLHEKLGFKIVGEIKGGWQKGNEKKDIFIFAKNL